MLENVFSPYCLLANVIGKFQMNPGQPNAGLTSKFKIERKETLLS